MNNVSQLLQERQNMFIECRTRIESEVNQFLQSLERQDEDIKQRCNVVPGRTAKDVLPSLWAPEFDEQQYQVELANLNNYINAVIQIQNQNNQEALQCLQS